MKTSLLYKWSLLGLLLTSLSCGPIDDPTIPQPQFPLTNQYGNEVYLEWNELYKELDKNASGYRPGPATRALAYLGLSAYESVVAGMPFHQSLAPLYQGLDIPEANRSLEYYWPACVSESYAFLLAKLFPHLENSPNAEVAAAFEKIGVLRNHFHSQFVETGLDTTVLHRSEMFGRAVAFAVFEWSKTDMHGHNTFLDPQPTSYTPNADPGNWQPTPPDFERAMHPSYGGVRTFAIDEGETLIPPPIQYTESPSSPFYPQALEVWATVNAIKEPPPGSENWAYNQKWMGEFWSDDNLYVTFSTGTRWISIANQMVENEASNLATCAELYAKLGLALSDVAVATWLAKYTYNVERPISYIRRIISIQNPTAEKWTTLLNDPATGFEGISPSYPSYPSAHASLGGGASIILSSFFENTPGYDENYGVPDLSHQLEIDFLGMPRYFTSISELAEECAYSRIPLGVNYRMDCESGLALGREVAQRVQELPWKK
jgi:hypothetical protein